MIDSVRRAFRENGPRSTASDTILVVFGVFVLLEWGLAYVIPSATSVDVTHGSLTLQWAAAGLIGPLTLAIMAFGEPVFRRVRGFDDARRFATVARIVLVCASLVLTAWILVDANRRFILIVGGLQGLLFYRLTRRTTNALPLTAALGISAVSWVLTLGFTWVSLANALLGALPDSNLFPLGFIAALVLVAVEFAPSTPSHAPGASRRIAAVCALLFFAWQGLRIDLLTGDWIPYHEGYFTSTADFVRQGHWLLWDVPSQYGFLSIVAIALLPVANEWQALHITTAIILSAQASMAIGVFWSRARSWRSFATTAAIAAAANFTAGGYRSPFGPRLYPQSGMRLLFVTALIFIAFRMFRATGRNRDVIRLLGTGVWAVGCFWAFENLVWSTIAWVGFLAVEATIDVATTPGTSIRTLLLSRGLPLVALPSVILALVDGYYAASIHHLPDWRGFFEFSSIYTSDGSYHLSANPFGGGWVLFLVLAGIGAQIVAAARIRRYDAIPTLAMAWLATWATATYYLGEPFDNHVNLLAPLMTVACAVCLVVGSYIGTGTALRTTIAIAYAPVFVVLLSYAVPGIGPLLATRGPFIGPQSFDVVAHMPTIPPELAKLEERAGIRPHDAVLFPSRVVWVKVGLGIIFPFVEDPTTGQHVEQLGWLPFNQTGMINTLITLPITRQQTYIERFLDRSRRGGWTITFREPPNCSRLSPHLVLTREVDSINFRAGYCRYRSDVPAAERSRTL